MTQESWFASPLSLLHAWRAREDQAALREVLILGFTVDLPFLEQMAIATARGLGARITVLGDVHHGVYDPFDVHSAGTSYLYGLVRCSGAFHPKLMLLIGESEVWAAVGSGNPTMSGWGANDELWTAVQTTIGQPHPLVGQIAAWLRRLAHASGVAMTAWSAELLASIATELAAHPSDPQPHEAGLLDNLDTPLLEQLPSGPVDELCLYAPFTDPSGEAIRQLVDRFDPVRCVIGLQPRWSSYDGDALLRALAGRDVELRLLPEEKIRHGKLIQWRIGDRFCGLTGSPNLTRTALLKSVAAGGNCELAILAPHRRDLMPTAHGMNLDAVSGRRTVRPYPAVPDGPLLLGALVTGHGIEVTLAVAYDVDVLVESSLDASPGSWQPLGTVPAGRAVQVFAVPEIPGCALRAVFKGPNAAGRYSAVVFAVSPARCKARTDEADRPKVRREYTVEELFTDPAQAKAFSADLARLAQSVPARSTPAAGASAARTHASVLEDRWTTYLEDCRRTLGTPFTSLLFGTAHGAPPIGPRPSAWSISTMPLDAADGQDGENDPLSDQDTQPEDVLPAIPVPLRAKYRSWAVRWTRAVAPPSKPAAGAKPEEPLLQQWLLRMLVAVLHIRLLAAGLWDSGDETWRGQLSQLTIGLTAEVPADAPPESRQRAAALAAVCMTLLRAEATLTGGAPNDLTANYTWKAAKALAAEGDVEFARDLLLPPTQPRARVVTAAEVTDTIALARDTDPYAEMHAMAQTEGWELTEQHGLWQVTGSFTNPTPVGARLATLIGQRTIGPALVLARARGHWTLVCWREPDLVLLAVPGYSWRHYRLSPPATPASQLSNGDINALGGMIDKPVPYRLSPPAAVDTLLAGSGYDANALLATIQRHTRG